MEGLKGHNTGYRLEGGEDIDPDSGLVVWC